MVCVPVVLGMSGGTAVRTASLHKNESLVFSSFGGGGGGSSRSFSMAGIQPGCLHL